MCCCPTEDAIIPITDGREFAALIPGSQLVEVEGGDHNFKVPEHAAAAVEAIVAFMVANKAACA
jgi:pimeloyl-ACP methyl ester carboxylesterase